MEERSWKSQFLFESKKTKNKNKNKIFVRENSGFCFKQTALLFGIAVRVSFAEATVYVELDWAAVVLFLNSEPEKLHTGKRRSLAARTRSEFFTLHWLHETPH